LTGRIESPTYPGLQYFSSLFLHQTLMSDDFPLCAQELIKAGRFIDGRGWVPATSGNFSARLADGRIAITVSGRHKGRLTPADIMLIDVEGKALDGQTPSAETLLHTALYRRYPHVGAVLHPHSPGSILQSRLSPAGVVLENHELLKVLSGIRTHATRVTIPVFPNDQNIRQLANTVDDWLDRHGDVHAYIIANHGFYTWGATVQEALRHVEALEFLFDIESRLHGVKPL
jgi:methylthioribulose-1-phosphate dehydratase